MLLEASYLAATWRTPDPSGSFSDVLADPHLRVYLEGWPRPGDFAVIAEADGASVGAAWYRTFTADSHGYGFIESSIPELSVAVRASHRGRGLGTELLCGLIEHARMEGVAALSLSVEEDNPAVSLYQRLGFETVAKFGNAFTMRRDLLIRSDGVVRAQTSGA
jgi:ribosomal protein S18 acetylase RimI-like enzyme